MSKFFNIVSPNINLDFIGKSPIFSVVSLIAISVCLFGMFTKGFNFGIDFTGGTVIQMKFKEAKPNSEIMDLIKSLGESSASVVALGSDQMEFLVTVRTVVSKAEADKGVKPLPERLVEKVGAGNVQILKSDVVGPKVGAELKSSAMRSLFYSILFIMIYIWFRFDLKFAPGATLAMVHDLIFMCGFYIYSGHEFTITSIAALLTVAGYSVNDTIVIYDRVRELFKAVGDELPLKGTINKAINATLSRTLITSLSTLLALISLVIYTNGEIQDFAIAVCVGVLVGTYSTIYIAAPFTLLTQRFIDKQESKKDSSGRWKKAKA